MIFLISKIQNTNVIIIYTVRRLMNIKEKIIEIIQDLNEDFDPVEDLNIIEDGILDSFDIINFIMEAEEAFGVKIVVAEIVPENFESVDSIQKLIERLKNK